MAATTLSAILERFEAVLQAAPLRLTLTRHPYGDKLEANAITDDAVSIQSVGLIGARSQSNYAEARMERITVTLHRALSFSGYQAQRDLSDLCDAVVQALIADGADHDYDVTEEKGSRKQVLPKDSDVAQAQISLCVDYDWNEA